MRGDGVTPFVLVATEAVSEALEAAARSRCGSGLSSLGCERVVRPRELVENAPFPGETVDRESQKPDLESRERALAGLVDRTIIPVVVLESESDEADGRRLVQGACRDFSDWLGAALKELAEVLGIRLDNTRIAPILVFEGPPDGQDLSHVRRLLEVEQVRGVYVMGRRLQLGSGELFHSRQVWPEAVRRLLVRLAAAGTPERGGRARIYCWRSLELRPREGDAFVEIVAKARGHAKRLLQESTESEEDGLRAWRRTEPTKIPGVALDHGLSKPAQRSSFPEYRPGDVVRRALTRDDGADRFEEAWKRAGRAVAEALETGGSGLGVLASSDRHVVWRRVHRNPVESREWVRVLEAMREPDGPKSDFWRQFHWDPLGSVRKELEEDARVLSEAESGFLSFGVRLALGLASAAAVFVAGWMWFVDLFKWLDPIVWLSSGAFLGGLLGALVPYYVQKRVGERATRIFHDRVFHDLPRTMEEVHGRYVKVLAAAVDAGRRWISYGTARRTERFLLRLWTVLEDRLLGGETVAPVPRDEFRDPPAAAPDAGGDGDADLLARFRRETTCLYDVKPPAQSADSERLKQRLVEHTQRFRVTWYEWCQRHDPAEEGFLPAQGVCDLSAAFLRHADAIAMDHGVRAAIAENKKFVREWVQTSLAAWRDAPHSYHLSGRLRDEDADGEGRRLVLAGSSMGEACGEEVVASVEASGVLGGALLLCFEEVPVRVDDEALAYVLDARMEDHDGIPNRMEDPA